MAWVMINNILVTIGWLSAFCYMIYLDNDWWAAACIVGALSSGYNYTKKT